MDALIGFIPYPLCEPLLPSSCPESCEPSSHIAMAASASGHADEAEEEDQELDLDDPDLLNDEADSEENLEDADEDLDAEEDPDQTQEDPDDDGMGIFRQGLDQSSHPTEAAVAPSSDLLDEGGPSADVDATAGMSKHERQQARMQERIARLEAQNMAEKDWFMQGEAGAGTRPHTPPPPSPKRGVLLVTDSPPVGSVPTCSAHGYNLGV